MRLKIACSLFLNPLTGLVYFAFPQPTFSNPCEHNEICVKYIEQPFYVWYVWAFLILLLIFILRCLISCCLQCWIKRCTRYSSRRTVTVVTLSSLHSVYVSGCSQCHSSQTWMPHLNSEASCGSTVLSIGGLEAGAPPSYEELFHTSKL
ncbi:hypothetical protein XELAEV_18027487mg [Xenopus laevis]|uniref:Transmembrane protein 207 n=1 Tax=Xenopus laevis TaxID=8355 RepID=A0A974HK06_XENLA|nr:hypothetical protein XELAEV_18027487mg [Xenopus laevis]